MCWVEETGGWCVRRARKTGRSGQYGIEKGISEGSPTLSIHPISLAYQSPRMHEMSEETHKLIACLPTRNTMDSHLPSVVVYEHFLLVYIDI